jgi:hypothetical protein
MARRSRRGFGSVRSAVLVGVQPTLEAAGGLACVDSHCLVQLCVGRVRGYFDEFVVVGVCQVVELLCLGEAGESSVAHLTRRRGTVTPEAPPRCPGSRAET